VLQTLNFIISYTWTKTWFHRRDARSQRKSKIKNCF